LQRARVTDRRIFETRISGNLAITGALLGSRGRITGALSLEDTEIRIPSSGLGAGEYIPPLVHVNESAESLATRRAARLNNGAVDPNGRVPNAFALDLTLSSPNRVFIRGRGLDAELGGNLRLTGTTLDVVPAGEFTLLRGRLDILGRRFALSDGLARLQGRFIPFVRLTATTSTDGITASIVLEGEADRLQIRFLSVPELPEEEIVARLLFGRELGRLSPFQAAQLASAVATLAGRGGEGVVGNLRRSFGLDDLDVSTGENGLAAVRLGRYLSENIYTNVIVDAEGRSEVSINLDVSRSVTVRGRTDSEGRSGVGIFFERDY
jgi:translocation and assembly module TamB